MPSNNISSSIIAIFLLLVISCGPSKKGIFGDRKTAHEKYGDRIREAGLDKSRMGNLWFVSAAKSISSPLAITLPYKETGYFSASIPSATGYVFPVRRGDRLLINVSIVPDSVQVFAELWEPGQTPEKAELVAVADSTHRIQHDVETDGRLLVRLQPELLQGTEYTLTITTGPSLAFPVSESGKPRMISFWSAPRDGGARSHEGIDISAKFRTPAIASADGRVNSVSENRLGGKVVFMRPSGKNYSLYYAHLDTQIVNTGDNVKAGQVLGLVGNTGNAKNTVPHLHFGIYGNGGAMDPLAFIDPRRKEPAEIQSPLSSIYSWVRTIAAVPTGSRTIEKGEAVRILSAHANNYKVISADGLEVFITQKQVSSKILNTISKDSITRLLDQPIAGAASIKNIEPSQKMDVTGSFNGYLLVKHGEDIGWISQ